MLKLKDSKLSKGFIFFGNFNLTLYPWGKKGGTLVKDPFKEHMEDLISSFKLVDIKLMGKKYTWTNRRIGPRHITTCLDRFMLDS